jgi:hypothetical protein
MADMRDNVWVWVVNDKYIDAMAKKRGVSPSDVCKFEPLADYFHATNIMYFPPDKALYDASELDRLKRFNKVICNVGGLEGVKKEQALSLSKLSANYPNIVGGIIDDLSSGLHDHIHHALRFGSQSLSAFH